MNDNENMNPFFDGDNGNNEQPQVNLPEQDFSAYQPPLGFDNAESEAVGADISVNGDGNEDSLYEAVEQVKQESLNLYASDVQPEESNPYAQQTAYAEENPYAQQTAYTEGNPYAQQSTYGEAPQQVNPTYSQPVGEGTPYSSANPYAQGNPYAQSNNTYGQFYQPPKKSSSGKTAAIIVVAVCVFVAIIALVSSVLGNNGSPEVTGTQPTSAPTAQLIPTTSQNVTVSTTQPVTNVINSVWVAEKVRPSVVGVLAYQQGELAGEGSGVLMSEDKEKNCTYVVTCAHVIDEPNCDLAILLLDGTSYEAEVVAHDVRTDIGVLKVNTTGLPLAEFGDSSTLKVGEPIYAIGNPGGSEYFGSITNGIVASIDRSIEATYTMTCIQHNAAINPGNSGGALVNSAGQVIGINSSKIARTDYEGMGFAVPSSIFGPVVDALIQHGYVPNRPELGIKYASLSGYQLYSIIVSIKGLPKGSVIIAEIPEGSALAGTDAQVGDLITAVNGKKMDTSDVLLDLIDTGAVGDTITLTLCRIQNRSYDISTFDVTVKLVENKGSVTTTTQQATLPEQDAFDDFESFFGDFFNW